ncbi:MAG: conjugal transfer protein TraJ [Nitrospira sp. WS110]|nr:conjugal transfer protein TraJ [Nitrospira sp. WS110]
MKSNTTKTRRDLPPIRVYCSSDERETIEQQARSTGLSKSSYLLRVGMGYPIRSIVDHHHVEELVKINGDLGRLGGLLKLWLSKEQSVGGVGARTVRETLQKIETVQEQMLGLMQKVLRPQAEAIMNSSTSSRRSSDRRAGRDDGP